MSQRVSTAGMYLAYATESSVGVRPTSGYVTIPEVKSAPSFNPSPETIQSTTLMETEYHTFVPGLKSLGGALEYGANLTDDLVTFWDTLINAHDVAAASGKATWFALVHPKLAKATYFTGDPSPIGLNEASVGGMAETTLYITPTSAPRLEDRPTTSNVQLSALTVGNLSLSPSFNADTTSYTAATTHTTDVITAAPADSNATVTIASSDATISDTTATWAAGTNVVTVTVANGGASKVYTITVTKS